MIVFFEYISRGDNYMQTDKTLKDLVKKKLVTKEMLLNSILNYENRLKEVKIKIKEYKKFLENDPNYQKYYEIYKTEFRDLIFKKKELLMCFKPRNIVFVNGKYYLKFKEELKNVKIILFCRLYKNELFMYKSLKAYKNKVFSKPYSYDKYTMNFCNKIYDLINSGDYKII